MWQLTRTSFPYAKVIQFSYQRRSERAKAFEADDQARIEQGWTGVGQTNGLLGTISRYGRIWEGLADEELAAYIESVAVALPGYQDHCHHKDEIGKRSLEWARSSTKHYYPYSERAGKIEKPKHPTNEERKQGACERIKQAMTALIESGKLALGITSRCQQLSQYGVSRETLYKNKELWHPDHYQAAPPVESAIPLSQVLAETPLSSPSECRQPSQLPTFKITNPPQRSLGQSEPVFSSSKTQKKEQTILRGVWGEDLMVDVLSCVKEAVGKHWSYTLEDLVKSTERSNVLNALSAYREQLGQVKISNPGAWFYRAISNGYRPNGVCKAAEESASIREEFNHWFELAKRAGLVVASESMRDGQIWVYLADSRKRMWSELRQTYSIETLKSGLPGFLG